MGVGPKVVYLTILERISLDDSPRPVEEFIREAIVANPSWGLDPFTHSYSLLVGVTKYLEQHWNACEKEKRQPKFAFNLSSPYMIQGPCFVGPLDPLNVREQKLNRLYWKDYHAALKILTPREFEILCKKILSLLGIPKPVVTQYSGDEGIDFYGQLSIGDLIGHGPIYPVFESSLNAWMVGQAKHYLNIKVATPDIRDLVGAVYLGRSKAFGGSEVDKYKELDIRVCDPVFMLFFTTGEISQNGWALLKRSGVIGMDGEMVAAFLADKGVGVAINGSSKVFDSTKFISWLTS